MIKFTQIANLTHTYKLTNIHLFRCSAVHIYLKKYWGFGVDVGFREAAQVHLKKFEVLALILDEEATMRLKYLKAGPL